MKYAADVRPTTQPRRGAPAAFVDGVSGMGVAVAVVIVASG
jgi:hypothetical protein